MRRDWPRSPCSMPRASRESWENWRRAAWWCAKPDPQDGRRMMIAITAEGGDLIRATARPMVRILREYSTCFGADRLDRLADELARTFSRHQGRRVASPTPSVPWCSNALSRLRIKTYHVNFFKRKALIAKRSNASNLEMESSDGERRFLTEAWLCAGTCSASAGAENNGKPQPISRARCRRS